MDHVNNSGLVSAGLHWECIRCSKCCRNHFESNWVANLLSIYVGDAIDDHCPRLDNKTGLCLEHNNRPPLCKGFPFTLHKIEEKTYALKVYTKCPGIGKGPALNIGDKVKELVDIAEATFELNMEVDYSNLESNGIVIINSF